MPIVKITPAGDSIKCKAGQNGRFQFNISNPSHKEVRFSAEVKGVDKAIDWLTVDGSAERSLGSSATSTVEVLARPPANLLKMEEGNKLFNFKLRVHNASDPDDTVDSVTVSVEVIPAPPPPKKFPWWIVILLAVVGLGVVIWLSLGSESKPVVSFASPTGNVTVDGGSNLSVKVNATDEDEAISKVTLLKDGVPLARIKDVAPYEWNVPGGVVRS